MQPIIQVTVLGFCLVFLLVYFTIITSKLIRLIRSSENSERILQRMLELIKESSNARKARERM